MRICRLSCGMNLRALHFVVLKMLHIPMKHAMYAVVKVSRKTGKTFVTLYDHVCILTYH